LILFSKKRYSKIITILSSFYAVGLLILALGYSFLSDSSVYKISPELSVPKPKIIEESSPKTSSNVSNNFKVKADKIELRLNDPNFLIQGKKIYRTHCAVCHGINLEGQKGWDKNDTKANILAPPHDETGHSWHHSDQILFSLTKYGGSGKTGQLSAMPGYEQILTDDEIISVLSFIKSTWSAEIRQHHDQVNKQALN
jgi:S-disulfanyl-L-cysteine oxidoreductase SoxD